jgi:thiol-disulfide isomerase/thioredoxin
LEKQVAELIAGPQVTVVHFWAPWCPNCKAEMAPEGWAPFIAANPGVKVVFVCIWHKGQDPLPKLAAAGLGAQPNLLLLTHPNPSRLEADRLNAFLGLPLTWVPTTWVYRAGKLRVAFNYGEIRFPVLQQMIDDATNEWKR